MYRFYYAREKSVKCCPRDFSFPETKTGVLYRFTADYPNHFLSTGCGKSAFGSGRKCNQRQVAGDARVCRGHPGPADRLWLAPVGSGRVRSGPVGLFRSPEVAAKWATATPWRLDCWPLPALTSQSRLRVPTSWTAWEAHHQRRSDRVKDTHELRF